MVAGAAFTEVYRIFVEVAEQGWGGGKGGGVRGPTGYGGGGELAGDPAFRESSPRSGACDWPRQAMVAGAASTEAR